MAASLGFSAELTFTQEMLHGNIKGLSLYLIKQYLKEGSAAVATDFTMFLSFLADYIRMCENPGDSLVFVKILNALVLGNQLHQLRVEEKEGQVVKVTHDLEETLLQLKCDCPEDIEAHAEQLDKLINETRCQTILSYLKCKKMRLALDHFQAYSEKATTPHAMELFTMLKSMLSCYDEDGEVVTGGNEMQTIQSMLCSHLFVERHSWKKLCRDLRHFVSDCVVELEHRVPMFKENHSSISEPPREAGSQEEILGVRRDHMLSEDNDCRTALEEDMPSEDSGCRATLEEERRARERGEALEEDVLSEDSAALEEEERVRERRAALEEAERRAAFEEEDRVRKRAAFEEEKGARRRKQEERETVGEVSSTSSPVGMGRLSSSDSNNSGAENGYSTRRSSRLAKARLATATTTAAAERVPGGSGLTFTAAAERVPGGSGLTFTEDRSEGQIMSFRERIVRKSRGELSSSSCTESDDGGKGSAAGERGVASQEVAVGDKGYTSSDTTTGTTTSTVNRKPQRAKKTVTEDRSEGQIMSFRERIVRKSRGELSSSSCTESDDGGKGSAAGERGVASQEVDKGYTSSDTTTTSTVKRKPQRAKKTVTWDETVVRREQRPRRKGIWVEDMSRSSDESADSDGATAGANLQARSGVRPSVAAGRDAESEHQPTEPPAADVEGEGILGKTRTEGRGAGDGATSPAKKALSLSRTGKKHSWSATEVGRKTKSVGNLDGTDAEAIGGNKSREGLEVGVIPRTEVVAGSEGHRTANSDDEVGGKDGIRRRLRRRRNEGRRDGTGDRGSPMLGVSGEEGSPKLRASSRVAGDSKEVHTEPKDGGKPQATGESSKEDQPGEKGSNSPKQDRPEEKGASRSRKVVESPKQDRPEEKGASRSRKVAESPKQGRPEEQGGSASRVVETPEQDQAKSRTSPKHDLHNSLKYNLRRAVRNIDSNDDTESDDRSKSIRSKSTGSGSRENLLSPDKDSDRTWSDGSFGSPRRGMKPSGSSSSTPIPGSRRQGKASTSFISKRTVASKSNDKTVYDMDDEDDDVATPPSRLPARAYSLTFKPSSNFVARKQLEQITCPTTKHIPVEKRHGLGRKFGTAETEYLMAGIKKFGWGQWKEILAYYPFHPSRTSMKLKDKARNLKGRGRNK